MTTSPTNPDKQSLRAYLSDAFHLPPRWVVVMGWVYGIVFVAGAIICGVKMVQADDVGAKVEWAALLVLLGIAVAIIKLWYWSTIRHEQLQREIKRLADRLSKGE